MRKIVTTLNSKKCSKSAPLSQAESWYPVYLATSLVAFEHSQICVHCMHHWSRLLIFIYYRLVLWTIARNKQKNSLKSLKLEPDQIKVKKKQTNKTYNLIDFSTVKAGFHYLGYYSPLGLKLTFKYIVFIQHKGSHDDISLLNVQGNRKWEKLRNSVEKCY